MGELTQTEVYSPPRTQQVWKSLLSWFAFFFQIFSQIIRTLGHYPLLSSSSSSSASSSSTSSSFKPLPSVELQDFDSSSSALEITADFPAADQRPFQKLTVLNMILVSAIITFILVSVSSLFD